MSTAPSGTFWSNNSVRIQEFINKSMDLFLPALSPVWRNTIVTSQGVASADTIGRDMKVLKTYMGSFAGVLEQAAPRGDFPLYGDDAGSTIGAKMLGQGISRAFPDALESPMARPFRLGVGMRAMVANFPLSLAELQADASPAFIGDVVIPKLQGFGRLISHTICNYWWLDQANKYSLCALGTASPTIAGAGPWTITFTVPNRAVSRFFQGQRVDIYSADGNTLRNNNSTRIRLFVSAVDPLTAKVTLITATGGGTPTDPSGWSLAADDIIVFAGSRGSSAFPSSASAFTGIAGINSWMKGGSGGNDNILMGAEADSANQIDVTVHPEFKTLTKNMGGQPMTEHQLIMLLSRFHAAKGPLGRTIDTLVASEGVWLAYRATKIGREYMERSGTSSLNSEGMEEGFKISVDGRTYTGLTDSYVESGTIYGFKRGGNNWKRYVPPGPKGTRKSEQVESFIPFELVGPALTGGTSNYIPIFTVANNRNLVTEFVQMPGQLRMQLIPDQPDGMKITNVAEDRIYSDN